MRPLINGGRPRLRLDQSAPSAPHGQERPLVRWNRRPRNRVHRKPVDIKDEAVAVSAQDAEVSAQARPTAMKCRLRAGQALRDMLDDFH